MRISRFQDLISTVFQLQQKRDVFPSYCFLYQGLERILHGRCSRPWTPLEVQRAILSGDVDKIKSVKGIGPKTAQRAILELKDKIGTAETQEVITTTSHNTLQEEALIALSALGFSKSAAEKAMKKAEDKSGSFENVESLIKETLKMI